MSARTTRRLAAQLIASAAVLAMGTATSGIAMAAEGGNGQPGANGIGIGGANGRTDSSNGLVGTSADGVNPDNFILG